jgi:hypothetical protein
LRGIHTTQPVKQADTATQGLPCFVDQVCSFVAMITMQCITYFHEFRTID